MREQERGYTTASGSFSSASIACEVSIGYIHLDRAPVLKCISIKYLETLTSGVGDSLSGGAGLLSMTCIVQPIFK
jgi:hypothetical protein